MPVILTVPHDGGDGVPGVPIRSRGVSVRDLGTRDLAERTADLIEARSGQRPYLVIAKFSRRYIDANRAEAEALDSPDAVPAYRAYHEHVASFVAELRQRFPNGALLIDVHGQSAEPETIFRGTRDGLSIGALLARHGSAAIDADDGLAGALRRSGYAVLPPQQEAGDKEDARFNGGHTVFTYGSHTGAGIDAIQLEFGKNLRQRSRLAEDFADAILRFQQKYLGAAK